MNALIICNREGQELEPLTNDICVGLLPVAGRPLVEYTLDELARAGVRKALILVAPHADLVEATIGMGARWGINIDYALAREEFGLDRLRQRIAATLGSEFLAVRGDMLRGNFVTPFVAACSDVRGQFVMGFSGGRAAGVALCRGSIDALAVLAWDALDAARPEDQATSVDIGDCPVSSLESLRSYHRANLDVAAARYPHTVPAGLQMASGAVVARHAHLSDESLVGCTTYVGECAYIDPSAKVGDDAVVLEHSVVDRSATLESCLVMPYTYVGENVSVVDAIVCGDRHIDLDTGAVTHVVDSFLLDALPQSLLSDKVADWARRSLALLLLVASLPLWPVAAALSIWRRDGPPMRRIELTVGTSADEAGGADRNPRRRMLFGAWIWNTDVPVLRNLPLLLEVIRGKMRLVGAAPLTALETVSCSDRWTLDALDAPIGLVGPTQLVLPPDAGVEERLLCNAIHARQRSWRSDCRYLLMATRSLFTAAAWSPVMATRR